MKRSLLTIPLFCAVLACCTYICACGAPPETNSTPPQQEDDTQARISDRMADPRLGELVCDGQSVDSDAVYRLTNARATYTEHVQEMIQLPELPSGCEIVSLTIALNALGFDLDKTELTDNYLFIDGDEWGYLASPYDENGGGFPPGIAWTANEFLSDQGSVFHAYNLSDSPFDSLCALVDAGYPVLIWTTLNLTEPNFDENTENWYINEHCVVLYRVDGDTVYVSNPLEGLVSYDTDLFQHIYEECGSMALAVW